jgi:hypothetical protein
MRTSTLSYCVESRQQLAVSKDVSSQRGKIVVVVRTSLMATTSLWFALGFADTDKHTASASRLDALIQAGLMKHSSSMPYNNAESKQVTLSVPQSMSVLTAGMNHCNSPDRKQQPGHEAAGSLNKTALLVVHLLLELLAWAAQGRLELRTVESQRTPNLICRLALLLPRAQTIRLPPVQIQASTEEQLLCTRRMPREERASECNMSSKASLACQVINSELTSASLCCKPNFCSSSVNHARYAITSQPQVETGSMRPISTHRSNKVHT